MKVDVGMNIEEGRIKNKERVEKKTNKVYGRWRRETKMGE